MADNITVLNSTGGTFTLRMTDVGGGILTNNSIPTSTSGSPMSVQAGAAVTSTAQGAAVVVISSLSPKHLVEPSSAIQVTLTSNTVAVSSATVTLSSVATITPSSVLTITPSSNLTVGSVSSGAVSLISGANTANIVAGASAVTSTMSALVVALSTLGNFSVTTSSQIQITNGTATANVVAGSSAVTSTMSALVVALSTLGNFSVTTSSQVGIIGGTAGANTATVVAGSSAVTSTMAALVVAISTLGTGQSISTITSMTSGTVVISNGANLANVLAGSSTVTSTMASLVVALSSNGAGIIATGTPTTPSSQYISAVVVGDLLTGAANSSASNPVAIGGIYNSTNPTSVTSGQRVQAWMDKSGKQIAVGALRALKGTQSTIISCATTETNITATSSGGNLIDIYGLMVANGSTGQVQTVTIKDSSGGTVRGTVIVPSLDTRGFMLAVDSAWVQSASSQAWTATLSNSSGVVSITTMYVTNV
jgi:hypothetical protein